jgi:hypothetical protein
MPLIKSPNISLGGFSTRYCSIDLNLLHNNGRGIVSQHHLSITFTSFIEKIVASSDKKGE